MSQPRQYICDVCHAQLGSHEELQEHTRLEHDVQTQDYPCPVCGTSLETQEQLDKHRREMHPDQ